MSQTTTDIQQTTDRRHTVPKTRPIVRSAKNRTDRVIMSERVYDVVLVQSNEEVTGAPVRLVEVSTYESSRKESEKYDDFNLSVDTRSS